MSSKLNRHAYQEMIDGDVAALVRDMPDNLERRHIENILKDSVRVYYDCPHCSALAEGMEAPRTEEQRFEKALRDLLAHDLAEECQECAIGKSEAWARAKDLLSPRQPEAPLRRLLDTDPHCPSCGHNRDKSSVSSIDHEDGTRSCQICGTRWLEIEAPPSPPREKP
jgi:transcription elongation factor Elf1